MPTTCAPSESAARAARRLSRGDFFAEVVRHSRQQIAPELSGFRDRVNPLMLKVDFGNDRVHFEVWPDAARGQVEIGLHFEDGPASTAAYLAYFDRHIIEIKHLLGARVELERWTLSWGHLFELHPLQTLDLPFAHSVAQRLVAQIALLQPMVAEAAVPPEPRERKSGSRGRWSRDKKH